MKKIILLFMFALLCTSCSIEYNIHLDEYFYNEDIYIKESFSDYYDSKNWTVDKVVGYHKYLIDMELDEPSQLEYFSLSSYFDLYNSGAHLFSYNRSYKQFILPIYKCYENYIFEKDEENNIFVLKTSGKFLCSNYLNKVDDVSINVYSDYKLIETNSDDYQDGVYTWDIKNSKDKNIYLKLSLVEDEIIEKKDEPTNWKFIGTVVITIISIILVLFVVMDIIRKRENRI